MAMHTALEGHRKANLTPDARDPRPRRRDRERQAVPRRQRKDERRGQHTPRHRKGDRLVGRPRALRGLAEVKEKTPRELALPFDFGDGSVEGRMVRRKDGSGVSAGVGVMVGLEGIVAEHRGRVVVGGIL
jgi:hypothetical protein